MKDNQISDKKYIECSIDTIINNAYFLATDLNLPVGLEFNIQKIIRGKKIRVMIEVKENGHEL